MKNSQTQTLLRAFRESNGVLTPSDILRLGIAQYNARIKELREEGYRIESEYLGTFHGVKHTQFKLLSSPTPFTPTPSEKPIDFPSNSHRIAHENRMKKEAEKSQETEQLMLI